MNILRELKERLRLPEPGAKWEKGHNTLSAKGPLSPADVRGVEQDVYRFVQRRLRWELGEHLWQPVLRLLLDRVWNELLKESEE